MIPSVTAAEAYQALTADPDAVLVDVRTRPEWEFTGIPDLSAAHKEPALLSWAAYPEMRPDPAFAQRLRAAARPDQPVYFLCRSGARSHAAAEAAAAAGFTNAINISDGFEGPLSPDGHRDAAGWKVSRLPWRQG